MYEGLDNNIDLFHCLPNNFIHLFKFWWLKLINFSNTSVRETKGSIINALKDYLFGMDKPYNIPDYNINYVSMF